jgi:hypothetical protein
MITNTTTNEISIINDVMAPASSGQSLIELYL